MSRIEGNPKPQYKDILPEAKTAAYSKTYYEKNKEARRADGKIRASEYRQKYPEKVRATRRNQWLSQNFKRTSEWYDETLKIQGGHCALCDTKPAENKRFQVDHDHACCPTDKTHRKTCGKCVRGLLCESCNTELGSLEKFIADIYGLYEVRYATWTARAIAYLAQYSTQKKELK